MSDTDTEDTITDVKKADKPKKRPGPRPAGCSLFGDDELPISSRVFTPCWIDYPMGRSILKRFEQIYDQPKSYRPQCCLLIGEPAAGKTTIARRFLRSVNPVNKPSETAKRMPAVYVQSPPKADAAALYSNILRNIDAPYESHWSIARKQDLVLRMLTNLGTRLLIVDELHAMLAGHLNDRSVYMNVLKFLSNELQIPLIGIGTKDVNRAIQTDQQFGNRFEPIVLEPFKADKDYVRFMIQVCKHAGFDDTKVLMNKTIVPRLHAMTGGSVGETWRLVSRLIYFAETEGNGKLTADMLDKVQWVMPTLRRRSAT